jgi:hypothetical protein
MRSLDQRTKGPRHVDKGSGDDRRARNENDVVPVAQARVQCARRFPKASLDAVPHRSVSDTPTHHEPDAGRARIPAIIDITYK